MSQLGTPSAARDHGAFAEESPSEAHESLPEASLRYSPRTRSAHRRNLFQRLITPRTPEDARLFPNGDATLYMCDRLPAGEDRTSDTRDVPRVTDTTVSAVSSTDAQKSANLLLSDAAPPWDSHKAGTVQLRQLRLCILGDRQSGRTTLAKQLHRFCHKHRRLRTWRKVLDVSARDEADPRPPRTEGLGSSFHTDCELTGHVEGRPEKIAVRVCITDPGPTGLDAGVGHIAAACAPNVVCCVLSLVGVKQVRERVGRSHIRAVFGGAAREDAVLVHDDDVRRVTSMLRMANLLTREDRTPVTVILIGSFQDVLTDASVEATRAVLARLCTICEGIRQRDGLHLRFGSAMAADLVEGSCITATASDSAGPARQPESPFSLFVALHSLCVGAPLAQAGLAAATMTTAPMSRTKAIPPMVALLRELKDRREVPPIVQVEQLERLGFALHHGSPCVAELVASVSALCEAGELMAVTGYPLAGNSGANTRVCLFPALLVAAHGLAETIARTAQRLREPHPALVDLASSLHADEAVLLRGGVFSRRVLVEAASLLLARTPSSKTRCSCDPDREMLGNELADLLSFSGFGNRCTVMVHSSGARHGQALHVPSLSIERTQTPVEVLRLAALLTRMAEQRAESVSLTTHSFLVVPLSLRLSGHPPSHFSSLTAALTPLLHGAPFSSALWLCPPCETPSGVAARALLYADTATDSPEDSREVRLLCVADSSSAAADLALALLEQHVLQAVEGLLSRQLAGLTVSVSDDWETEADAMGTATPSGPLSVADMIHRLDRFFTAPAHAFIFV